MPWSHKCEVYVFINAVYHYFYTVNIYTVIMASLQIIPSEITVRNE